MLQHACSSQNVVGRNDIGTTPAFQTYRHQIEGPQNGIHTHTHTKTWSLLLLCFVCLIPVQTRKSWHVRVNMPRMDSARASAHGMVSTSGW